MNFGSRLSMLRKARNLTQSDLAKMIRVTTRTIQNYESCDRESLPGKKMLSALSEALQVDDIVLLNDDACNEFLTSYDVMMSSINKKLSSYQKKDAMSFILPSLIPIAIFNPIAGGAIGGAAISQKLCKDLIQNEKRKELAEMISEANDRCTIEFDECRRAIDSNQKRYRRKSENSSINEKNNSNSDVIIELIFAYQECMFIWYEQHMIFIECMKILQKSRSGNIINDILPLINKVTMLDKDKKEVSQEISRLEAKLQESTE